MKRLKAIERLTKVKPVSLEMDLPESEGTLRSVDEAGNGARRNDSNQGGSARDNANQQGQQGKRRRRPRRRRAA